MDKTLIKQYVDNQTTKVVSSLSIAENEISYDVILVKC